MKILQQGPIQQLALICLPTEKDLQALNLLLQTKDSNISVAHTEPLRPRLWSEKKKCQDKKAFLESLQKVETSRKIIGNIEKHLI